MNIENQRTTTDLLPGGGEQASSFLETILNNDLDGILYLQGIYDNKDTPFDYIIRYYNPVFLKTFKALNKGHLQAGLLLFEIFPGLKKNLTFFRAEKILGKNDTAEFTKYFDNDGLDLWLNVRITRFMNDGFIVNINDKTNEIKERIWSEANLKSSELLLKNHYWRLAITPILQQIHKASLASRVNLYLLEDIENCKAYQYYLIDSWMDDFIDEDQERLRSIEIFHMDDPIYINLMDNLLRKKIINLYPKQIQKYPENIQDIFRKKNLHRVVVVPIIYGDGLVGFIQIENPKGRFLYTRERRTLKNIADNFSAAILRRITRKRIEESQIHYRTLVEKLNAVVYKTDIKTPLTFTYINPNIQDLMGINREAFLDDPTLLLRTCPKTYLY
ncbi:MAG: GAF domain-containing protein [Leptospira sp.]|nr:GAF domain-containing protein [Leptospira sp.]